MRCLRWLTASSDLREAGDWDAVVCALKVKDRTRVLSDLSRAQPWEEAGS